MAGQNMPAAEVEIDADLVRRLLQEQRPELADLPIQPLAYGWDNVSFRLGVDLVARLPRREASARLIHNEARWLPELAPRLPLPVPAPRFLGSPGYGYPWHWLIAPLIPGVPASVASDIDYETTSRQLAEFLSALHRPAPADAPENPFRGGPLIGRDTVTRERLETFEGRLDVARLAAMWEASLRAPEYQGPPLWLHGDLHSENLLVLDGELSGIVDFGDITAGDPATDLAVVWSFLPSSAAPTFWRTYGERDAGLLLRARGWALSLGMAILANSADNPVMEAVGERAIQSVLGRA